MGADGVMQRQRRVSSLPAVQNTVYLAQTGGQHQQQRAQPPQRTAGRSPQAGPSRSMWWLPKNSHAEMGLVPVLHAAVFANRQVFAGRLQFFQALLLVFARGQALRCCRMGSCHCAVAFDVLLFFLLRMRLGLRQHDGGRKQNCNAREPNTAHDEITLQKIWKTTKQPQHWRGKVPVYWSCSGCTIQVHDRPSGLRRIRPPNLWPLPYHRISHARLGWWHRARL